MTSSQYWVPIGSPHVCSRGPRLQQFQPIFVLVLAGYNEKERRKE
jgi:hypothetical protein